MDRQYTIRIVCLASGYDDPELSGMYIVSYDPEYHYHGGCYDGGDLRVTRDRSQAALFDIDAATALWKSGPTCECHRLRADGQPNRPLTAFTVEFDSEPVAATAGSREGS